MSILKKITVVEKIDKLIDFYIKQDCANAEYLKKTIVKNLKVLKKKVIEESEK